MAEWPPEVQAQAASGVKAEVQEAKAARQLAETDMCPDYALEVSETDMRTYHRLRASEVGSSAHSAEVEVLPVNTNAHTHTHSHTHTLPVKGTGCRC